MLLYRRSRASDVRQTVFQWAPTLGGECYIVSVHRYGVRRVRFNGHPPLGVNATNMIEQLILAGDVVSMGTHPWG